MLVTAKIMNCEFGARKTMVRMICWQHGENHSTGLDHKLAHGRLSSRKCSFRCPVLRNLDNVMSASRRRISSFKNNNTTMQDIKIFQNVNSNYCFS